MTHLRKALAATTVLALAACRDAAVTDADTPDAAATDAPVAFQSAVSVSDDQLLDEPFIYSVTDADSEVILYPTFHILPEGVEWKSERLDAAIARADEVWYEIPVGSDQDPALQALTMELGMSDTPLSERLSDAQRATYEASMQEIGLPAAAFEPMQPWLAAVSIPLFQMMQAGYNPTLGVEAQLQQITGEKGQRAFETAEEQLRMLSGFSEDEQIAYLMQTVEDAKEGTAMIDALAAAWASGDMSVMENEFIAEMKADSPALYDVLITKRNADWAEQLDAEMKGAGVDFVAVGAGHLVGPDSVPAMMADRGYDVKVLTLK